MKPRNRADFTGKSKQLGKTQFARRRTESGAKKTAVRSLPAVPFLTQRRRGAKTQRGKTSFRERTESAQKF